jgi:hypothetical protein
VRGFVYHGTNHEGAAMAVRHMRLALGLFFLLTGATLLVLRFGVPEVGARFNTMRLLIGALMALALAGLNLSKWYAGWMWYQQQATPVRPPLRRNPNARSPEEVLPEFDFSKSEADARDKPPV